jgi:hypothetical protein
VALHKRIIFTRNADDLMTHADASVRIRPSRNPKDRAGVYVIETDDPNEIAKVNRLVKHFDEDAEV